MNKFPGGHRGRVTPVPIPNTEVKPATADGTACVGVWESRSLPGIISKPTRVIASAFFLYRQTARGSGRLGNLRHGFRAVRLARFRVGTSLHRRRPPPLHRY